MAEDLKLEIVIQALLDAKGFEDAKANLSSLATTANAAAPAIQKTGESAKKMGESMGGTRGPVADLTRILLQQVGVTGAAGEAAKAAGTAMYFLEGAATASAVAISGGVAAIAILLPKLIDWFSATEEQTEEQNNLRDSLEATSELINRLIQDVPQLAAKYREIAEVLHGAALDKQTDRLRELLNRQGELQKKIAETTSEWQKANYAREIEQLQAEVRLLMAAQEQHVTVTEMVTKEREKHTKATDRDTKAVKEKTAAVEKLTEAQKQDIDAQIDIIRFNEREAKKRRKDEDEEVDRLLAFGRLREDQAAIDDQIARQRRMDALTVKEMYANAITTALAAFTSNKSILIAGAIADTFAAANKAWAQGGIYAAPMVALIIASGMANVQQIRKAEPGGVGFDDPFADMTARKLGQKSAVDFVRNFAGGFTPGVVAGMGAMGGHTQNTTINRGTTINMGGIHGALGPRPAFDKWLERAMVKATRARGRTTLGR